MTLRIKKTVTPFLVSVLHFRQKLGRNPPAAYGLGFLICAVGLLLRIAIDGILPPGFPFMTIFPAVIFTTFAAGSRPAVVSAFISGLIAWRLWIVNDGDALTTSNEFVVMTLYFVSVAVVIFTIDALLTYLDEFDQARQSAIEYAAQRDMLFTELQHRVGNNLGVVSSLLNLQARTIESASAKLALLQASNRISLIADINRMFHDPTRAAGVFDSRLALDIIQKCVEAFGAQERVKLNVEIETIELAQEHFLSLILIMTECVNNALEHGLGDESGELSVSLRPAPGERRYLLEVRDNGSGLADDFDLATSKSIGLTVVKFFSKKLDGAFSLRSGDGCVSEMEFTLPQLKDRFISAAH